MGQEPTAARKRSRERDLALAAGALLAALALGEAAVRVLFPGEVDTEALRALDRQLEIGAFIRPSADPDLLYELEPGVNVQWFGVTVATSADGSARVSPKDAAAPRTPADGGGDRPRRVALLGDSTPFGWKTEYEHAYGELFRQRLRARLGSDVELRDYAVPGYNSRQERLVFERRVIPWRPDLAILHYDHNDPDPTNTAPVDYVAPEVGDNPLHSALWKFIVRRIEVFRRSRSSLFREEDGGASHLVDGYRTDGPRYDDHLEELRRLGADAAAAGIPVVVMIYDSGLTAHADPAADPHWVALHRDLVPRLEADSLRVLDLYPRYQALMAARGWSNLTPFWLAPEDGHPNRYGHLFLAEALLDFVLAHDDLRTKLAGDAAPTAVAR